MNSFQDAVATIRRTGTEYQYQLVVTRAYEEGEEQLLDEDAESKSWFGFVSVVLTDCEMSADDERVFLIDQSLQFRFGTLDGDATCSWKDLSGEEGDLWEFVSSKVCAWLHQLCFIYWLRLIVCSQSHELTVRAHSPTLHVWAGTHNTILSLSSVALTSA